MNGGTFPDERISIPERDSRIAIFSIIVIVINLLFGIPMCVHSWLDDIPAYRFSVTRELMTYVFFIGMVSYPASLLALVISLAVALKYRLSGLAAALGACCLVNLYLAYNLVPLIAVLFAYMGVSM